MLKISEEVVNVFSSRTSSRLLISFLAFAFEGKEEKN
jgi:hypothetical protein